MRANEMKHLNCDESNVQLRDIKTLGAEIGYHCLEQDALVRV